MHITTESNLSNYLINADNIGKLKACHLQYVMLVLYWSSYYSKKKIKKKKVQQKNLPTNEENDPEVKKSTKYSTVHNEHLHHLTTLKG